MASPLEIAGIGWAVSPILNFLINKLDYLKNAVERTSGIEADLNKLGENLLLIKPVVDNAEALKDVDPSVARLLRVMKEAMYDADDVIDEYSYYRMLRTEANEESWIKRAASVLETATKRLFNADQLQVRLSKAVNQLEQAIESAKSVKAVMDVANNTIAKAGRSNGENETEPKHFRETKCSRSMRAVGREEECKTILEKILEHESNSPPLVISVVGTGGIGKTTLAQLVYKHEEIGSFEIKIWMCVAGVINDVTLTKKILEEVYFLQKEKEENKYMGSNPNTLGEELQRSLASKKFLLVLDDVWVDKENDRQKNKDTWDKFFAPLQSCAGSSILVTTRQRSVVDMLESGTTIDLAGLSWEDSCSLFKSHAFPSGISSATDKELWEIGEKNIKNLGGSPLALSLVGGQLRNNYTQKAWTEVLGSGITKKVTDTLRLSYDNLPSHLKVCFAYCSLFPKDYYFSERRVDQLIHMWIAQGYVVIENGNALSLEDEGGRLEDKGRSYFEDLCSRSLFHPVEVRYGTSYYVMHELINDLARSVSKEECCQINDVILNQSNFPPTLRHVSVSSSHLPILKEIPRLNKLRSLLIFDPTKQVSIPMSDDILASLTGARVLNLIGCCIKQLPETIEQMIHLRYLAFCRTSTFLPETCSKLFHLQVIAMIHHRCTKDLDSCAPKNMSRLKNLRHVYLLDNGHINITGPYKIPQYHGDCVFTVDHNKGNKLKDIAEIGFAGKLTISQLENVASARDALDAQIWSKKHMKELYLQWGSSTNDGERTTVSPSTKDDDVLEGLIPHPNLSHLTIDGYRGLKPSFWFEKNWLISLRSLYLCDCRELRELPPLGHLPKLEVLTIFRLNAVKKITREFYGTNEIGFPSMKKIDINDMENLEEICMLDNHHLFPLLQEVSIQECPKLMRIANIFLDTKARICLDDGHGYYLLFTFLSCESKECSEVPHNNWRELIEMGTILYDNACIYWKVTDGSGFRFVSGGIESLSDVQRCKLQILSHLKAVKDLYLVGCTEFELPKDGFKELSSLERLFIEQCAMDLTPGHEDENDNGDLFPTSLKTFIIKDSLDLSNFLSRCLQCRALSSLLLLEIEDLELSEKQIIDLQWLTSLTRLRIAYCGDIEDINGFEALTCLTTIEILVCYEISIKILMRCNCPRVSPPHANCLLYSLKHLTWGFDSFQWEDELGLEHFNQLPRHHSLETLEIIGGQPESILGFLWPFSSLSILKIDNFDFFRLQYKTLDMQHSRRLEVLHIINCSGPLELINCNVLTLLKELVISESPDLIIYPAELDLLYSIQIKELGNCTKKDIPKYCWPTSLWETEAKEGHNWDKLAALHGLLPPPPSSKEDSSEDLRKRTKVKQTGQKTRKKMTIVNRKKNRTKRTGTCLGQQIKSESHAQDQELPLDAKEEEKEDANEVQEIECDDKALAKGTGYPSEHYVMLHGSSLQSECVKPSCEPSRPEETTHSFVSCEELLNKHVDFDRLGPDGLNIRDWILAHGSCENTLKFHPPKNLFSGGTDIVITYKDIEDLLMMKWLNVSVIQLYMMKLYNICRKENIQNIGFLDPAQINATQLRNEEVLSITYMAEAMQSQQIILAPFFQDHHWVLLVITPTDGTVYVLDSLNKDKGDKNYVIKDALTQAFSIYEGPNKRGSATRWITDHPSPQQIGGVECGYYVMNLMQDIIIKYREFPEDTLPIIYTQEEIDSIRQSWIKYFLEEEDQLTNFDEREAMRNDEYRAQIEWAIAKSQDDVNVLNTRSNGDASSSSSI